MSASNSMTTIPLALHSQGAGLSPASSEAAQGPSARRTARVAGWWFVVTFVASIPAVLLYDPLLNDAGYILGAGADTRIQLGALLEVVLVIANIATAVVLFPILKRQSETIALGYVATRIVESTIIAVGIVSVLSVLTLRQDLVGAAGADAAALDTVGRSLVAVHDATFLLGPAFCAGFGNGLLLGYLMYASGLVPKRMAMLGLIGGPLAFAGAVAVLFGAFDLTSAPKFLLTVPEIVWEASLGIYLIVKGFRTTSAAAAPVAVGPAR
jgi:Domain of unknown function (DUF4386)